MRSSFVVLALIAAATVPTQQRQPTSKPYSLQLIGETWSLALPLEGFIIFEGERRPDRTQAKVHAVNHASGIELSAYLEPLDHAVTSSQCRDFYWPKALQMPATKKDVHTYDAGRQARGEFFVDTFNGKPVHYQAIDAYIGVGRICADVHVSKEGFTGPADRAKLEAILNGISVRGHP